MRGRPSMVGEGSLSIKRQGLARQDSRRRESHPRQRVGLGMRTWGT